MTKPTALTEIQKQQRFKQLQSRNYKASMRLEGIHWVETLPNLDRIVLTEAEKIAELTLHYAR